MLNLTIKNIGNSFEFGFFKDKTFNKKGERIVEKKENLENNSFLLVNLMNINGTEGTSEGGRLETLLLKVGEQKLGRANFIFSEKKVVGGNKGGNFPTEINLRAEEKKLIYLDINEKIEKVSFHFIVDNKIGTATEFILEFTPGKGFVFKPKVNSPAKTDINRAGCFFRFN